MITISDVTADGKRSRSFCVFVRRSSSSGCTVNDIHPPNKKDPGRRLARWALAKDYGHDDIVFSGPMLVQTAVGGSKASGLMGKVTLTFEHCGKGLVSNDGEPLSHFEVGGSDGVFQPAVATIVGPDTIQVEAEGVPRPDSVRYAWHELAIGNLANSEGLPAGPFRTKRPADDRHHHH